MAICIFHLNGTYQQELNTDKGWSLQMGTIGYFGLLIAYHVVLKTSKQALRLVLMIPNFNVTEPRIYF